MKKVAIRCPTFPERYTPLQSAFVINMGKLSLIWTYNIIVGIATVNNSWQIYYIMVDKGNMRKKGWIWNCMTNMGLFREKREILVDTRMPHHGRNGNILESGNILANVEISW